MLELVAYVKRGKNRKRVFLALDDPKLPSELTVELFGRSTNTSFNIVSRALGELVKQGLVEVINPKEVTGRIYQKTTLGKQVSKLLGKN